MSLIDTRQLNDVNPFHNLTQLRRNADELASGVENEMPWNYTANKA
jgi:hypothetical protein